MAHINLVTEYFEYDSSEEEAARFFGDVSHVFLSADAALAFPSGKYRVVDGELFKVMEGQGVKICQ